MKLKITALFLSLVLVIGLLAGCGGKDDNGGSSDGDKIDVKIVLVLEDKTEKPYDLHVTKGATLREALFEAGLITEDTYYAMFVEDIDGNVADVLNDGCTWMPTDTDGNQITGTFDEIIVEDGQTINLVYYVVPDFD